MLAAHDDVARVLPLGDGGDGEPGCRGGRQVLHTVDHRVDLRRQEGELQFLDKEADVWQLMQRAIGMPVRHGADRAHSEMHFWIRNTERPEHEFGLPQGKLAPARPHHKVPRQRLIHRATSNAWPAVVAVRAMSFPVCAALNAKRSLTSRGAVVWLRPMTVRCIWRACGPKRI